MITTPRPLSAVKIPAGTAVFALALALFSLVLFPDVSPAEDQDTPAKTLTLDEAISGALRTNESVIVAREGVVQASSGLNQSTAALLPSLSVEGRYTRYSRKQTVGQFLLQPEETQSLEVRLSQPLYIGGKNWSARRQAGKNLERSRVGLEDTREAVVLDAASAYYQVLKARRNIEIAEAARKRAAERLKVAEGRFEVGEVTRADVLRAEAELAGTEAELTAARSLHVDSVNILKRITGATGEVRVTEPTAQKEPQGDAEAFVQVAYANRGDYRQSILDQDVAEEGIRFAWGSFLPNLSLEGSYVTRGQSPATTFFLSESLSGALVLSYPIFEGGLRKAELDEARSTLREAELRRLALKRDIEVEVREALNALDRTSAVIKSFEKQLASAQENYEVVFEQFKAGLATTVDVIDADSTLVSAQRNLMISRYDLELAVMELKRTVGVLLEEMIGEGGADGGKNDTTDASLSLDLSIGESGK